ncbi:MAG: hypothetical protein VZR10_10550 [Methanobrevibacter sp.]|nr:hypothetical protein [Methanobrevibacter sp.]
MDKTESQSWFSTENSEEMEKCGLFCESRVSQGTRDNLPSGLSHLKNSV